MFEFLRRHLSPEANSPAPTPAAPVATHGNQAAQPAAAAHEEGWLERAARVASDIGPVDPFSLARRGAGALAEGADSLHRSSISFSDRQNRENEAQTRQNVQNGSYGLGDEVADGMARAGGGFLQGATGLLSGAANMVAHPLNTAAGLARTGAQLSGVTGQFNALDSAAVALVDGGGLSGAAGAYSHSMEQDRANTRETLGGLARPITEAYEHGGIESAGGAVLAQVAAFAAGGGLRGGAARTGAARAGTEATAAEATTTARTASAAEGFHPGGGVGDWAEGFQPPSPSPLQARTGPLAPPTPAAPLTPLRPTPHLGPRFSGSVRNAPATAAEVPFTSAHNAAHPQIGRAHV